MIDLCYERLVYDAAPHNLPKIFGDAMRDRLVLAGSASKAYAMTGWRCGWLAGPKAGGAGRQRAAEPRDVERELDHAARRRSRRSPDRSSACATCARSTRRGAIRCSPGWPKSRACECAVPQGAFYLFPSVSEFLSPDRHRTSLDFADALLARSTS